jgi:hypothetical protein
MTEDALDPPARPSTTWRRLLDLSDEEVRDYVAEAERKRAAHRAAGEGEAAWWASKSITAGEYELEQRRRSRAESAEARSHQPLPRAPALQIVRQRMLDPTPETWVRDARFGWVCLESTEAGGATLEDVLSEIDDGAVIDIVGPGCTTEDVIAALPSPEDVHDGVWEFVVTIDSVDYGPFPGHGWLPVDQDHPTIPAHRILVEITFSEEGGFTSGLNIDLLGEVRPGLLVRYWNVDGADSETEIIRCEPADYAEQMRSVLVGATDVEQLAIDLALAEGSGSWTGDELDPDEGSPTATVTVTYDESILPPSG